MKFRNILYTLCFILTPLFSQARPTALYSGSSVSYTVQKKHLPVVNKALELMASDLKSNSKRSIKTELLIFQLDMASNKDMKTLGEMQVPVMDIIAKKDAFWIGVRGTKTVIVGSNGRGTAYGILQFAKAGNPQNKVKGLTEIPSVEYRGISLEGSHKTNYHQLFENMLRRRINFLCEGWDSGNVPDHFVHSLRQKADSFGILLATPHGSHGLRLQSLKKSMNVNIGWADDNYGYIAPVDDGSDNGVVYHLAYAGKPHSYLWLCTTQPGLIANEMQTAYRKGADHLWMAVVYNPDVAAYQLDLMMDMAWNIKSVNPSNTRQHLRDWLTKQFNSRVANALVEPLSQYFRLTDIRKPEFMDFTQQKAPSRHNKNGDGGIANTDFNAEEFDNELDRYLNNYYHVCKQVREARHYVADEDSDKFFTLVEYPVCASAQMAVKMLESQESRLIARPVSFHHDSEALESAARSIKAYRKIQELTSLYNNAMARMRRQSTMDAAPQDLAVFGAPQLTDTLSEAELQQYGNYTHSDAALDNDNNIVGTAARYAIASQDTRTIDLLGRSLKAVELNQGDSLTYRFTSGTVGGVLRLSFVPTHALDGGSLQCSVRIDNNTPRIVIITNGEQGEQWADDVLRGQALVTLPVALDTGSHTLTVKALSDHVVLDEWMIDRDADRRFYVFPVQP